jgi:hypothetical protein
MARGRKDRRNVDEEERKRIQRLEEIYEIVGKDPQAWLAQAKGLKMSADAIYPHLAEALSLLPTSRESNISHLHTFLYVFEWTSIRKHNQRHSYWPRFSACNKGEDFSGDSHERRTWHSRWSKAHSHAH